MNSQQHHIDVLAVLLVEREILDVDLTRRLEYDHREPRDVAVIRHDHVGADLISVARHVSAKTTKSH